jgi:hypothetical protein
MLTNEAASVLIGGHPNSKVLQQEGLTHDDCRPDCGCVAGFIPRPGMIRTACPVKERAESMTTIAPRLMEPTPRFFADKS